MTYSAESRIRRIARESLDRAVVPAATPTFQADLEFGRRYSAMIWRARAGMPLDARKVVVSVTIDDSDDLPDSEGRDFRWPRGEEQEPMADDRDDCDEDTDGENCDEDDDDD